jgi:site-specific recombinase XerC
LVANGAKTEVVNTNQIEAVHGCNYLTVLSPGEIAVAIKHDLQHSIKQVLFRSNESSHTSRDDRYTILMKFAADVVASGNKLRHVHGLKSKHVQAVIKRWQDQHLTSGTLKNRLSALRFLAEKIGKTNIIPSNTELAIPARVSKPRINRAIKNPDFSTISNPYVLISLQLQRVFGLRREESLKIRPHLADHGNLLVLQPSWCKGGRGRNISIQNDDQRYWLEQAKALVEKSNSLIPPNKSYIQQREVYDKQVNNAGIRNPHGLRHAFAQALYKELTGWEAPINGGPTAKELTAEQKKKDHEARMIISESLGHGRLQIVKNYLGK